MSTPSTPSAPSSPSGPASNPATGVPNGSAQAKTSPQGKPETPPAPAAGPSQAAQAAAAKLKVKGSEYTEDELANLIQHGQAANNRFQEAAKMRKEAEAILKYAKDNPTEFFQKTGMNAREWAEQFLMGELQKESESPEQKRARENEEQLRKYQEQEKQQKEKALQQERDRMTNAERERLDKLFTQALFESGLPRTKFTVKRMAELQLINIKNKYELSAPQLAKLVREDYVAEQKAIFGSLEGDSLLDFLGPDLVKKFSKAQIAKLKARGSAGASGKPQTQVKSTTQDEPGMTWKEYQRRNRRLPKAG